MNIKNIITITLFFSFLFVFGCNDNKSYFDKAVSCQNDADYTKAIEFYNLAIGKGEKIA